MDTEMQYAKRTGRIGHCPEERAGSLTLHGLWTGLGNSNQ